MHPGGIGPGRDRRRRAIGEAGEGRHAVDPFEGALGLALSAAPLELPARATARNVRIKRRRPHRSAASPETKVARPAELRRHRRWQGRTPSDCRPAPPTRVDRAGRRRDAATASSRQPRRRIDRGHRQAARLPGEQTAAEVRGPARPGRDAPLAAVSGLPTARSRTPRGAAVGGRLARVERRQRVGQGAAMRSVANFDASRTSTSRISRPPAGRRHPSRRGVWIGRPTWKLLTADGIGLRMPRPWEPCHRGMCAVPRTLTRVSVVSYISMRVIFTPQGEVAWSTTPSSRWLMSSRCDRRLSSSIEPMTVRMFVITMLMMAFSRLLTS